VLWGECADVREYLCLPVTVGVLQPAALPVQSENIPPPPAAAAAAPAAPATAANDAASIADIRERLARLKRERSELASSTGPQ